MMRKSFTSVKWGDLVVYLFVISSVGLGAFVVTIVIYCVIFCSGIWGECQGRAVLGLLIPATILAFIGWTAQIVTLDGGKSGDTLGLMCTGSILSGISIALALAAALNYTHMAGDIVLVQGDVTVTCKSKPKTIEEAIEMIGDNERIRKAHKGILECLTNNGTATSACKHYLRDRTTRARDVILSISAVFLLCEVLPVMAALDDVGWYR
jgi:hypothetical protein